MVLAFHKVEPRFTWGVTNYSPQRFQRLLVSLQRWKQSDAGAVGDVTLTFDDGYKSFLDYADPALIECGFTATIFAVSSLAGKSNSWDYSSLLAPSAHMTATELRLCVEHGHRVQSHGKTHRDLRTLSNCELKEELAESKDWIENVTGEEVDAICYPFGLYDRRVEEVAEEVGYKHGWSMNPRDNGPFTFGRWGVYAFDTPLTVNAKFYPDSFASQLEFLKLRTTNLMARAGRFAFWTT